MFSLNKVLDTLVNTEKTFGKFKQDTCTLIAV